MSLLRLSSTPMSCRDKIKAALKVVMQGDQTKFHEFNEQFRTEFKQLPFDDEEMEKTVIDKKLENLLSVLKWDLSKTRKENQYQTMF